MANPDDVPSNDVAQLMYYLYCINIVIKSDIESKYIDYKNYFKINEREIVYLVKKFKLRYFIDENIFFYVWDPNQPNVFYDLTNSKTEKKPDIYIMIDGSDYLVLKQMSVTYSWIDIYYSNPLKNLENKSYGSAILYPTYYFTSN